MNPVLIFYGLLLANVHRFTTGQATPDEFEATQRFLWNKTAEAHVTMQVLRMIQQGGRA